MLPQISSFHLNVHLLTDTLHHAQTVAFCCQDLLPGHPCPEAYGLYQGKSRRALHRVLTLTWSTQTLREALEEVIPQKQAQLKELVSGQFPLNPDAALTGMHVNRKPSIASRLSEK